MSRTLGIAFAAATHALFGVTVWYLFWFLHGPVAPSGGVLLRDGWLALQFALLHSLLLWPPTRRRLTAWIPAPFYGCFFCMATCLSLLLTIAFWRSSPIVLWSLEGGGKTAMEIAFLAAWVALFYSLSLTGLGYQTGWTPFWYWLRGRPAPRRDFVPRGAYHFLRHPIYLSFLALVWLTPRMSLDHAVLTGIWTLYIFVGSYLKDRRLVHFLGDAYRAYQARVPGYPLVPFGPLGKLRPNVDALPPSAPAEPAPIATNRFDRVPLMKSR